MPPSGRKGSDLNRLVGADRMEITPPPQPRRPLGTVETPYPVHHVWERVDGEGRERRLRKGARPVESVEVDAVVCVRVSDEDRINVLSGAVIKEAWQRTESEVEDHALAGRFEQVAAARTPSFRPSATAAEYGELHYPSHS